MDAGGAAAGAGWYDDPGGQYRSRWWDGTQWSEHVATADGTRLTAALGARAEPAGDGIDAGPLARELEAALASYGRLLGDLKAQRIDNATFRREVFRAGLVVHEDDAWLFDFANGRWTRYDGFGFQALTPGPA